MLKTSNTAWWLKIVSDDEERDEAGGIRAEVTFDQLLQLNLLDLPNKDHRASYYTLTSLLADAIELPKDWTDYKTRFAIEEGPKDSRGAPTFKVVITIERTLCEYCDAWYEAKHSCYGTQAEEVDYRREQGIDTDFADPGGTSALRAETEDNPRNLPCPNCGTPNRLTPADVERGYQCDPCSDQLERGGY